MWDLWLKEWCHRRFSYSYIPFIYKTTAMYLNSTLQHVVIEKHCFNMT